MDLRLIQEFSGDGSVNVIEWLEKAELVCALRGITRLEAVLPLRLTFRCLPATDSGALTHSCSNKWADHN